MCEVRPNFLFNSTGQLIRVKQWLPEIKTNPALSEVQNPEKNKAKSTEQTKFSPTRRTRGTKTSSSGATNPHFFSSDIAKKKDNLCRVAKQQKARVQKLIDSRPNETANLNALLGILDDTVSLLEPSSQTCPKSKKCNSSHSLPTKKVISPFPTRRRNVRVSKVSIQSSYLSAMSQISIKDEALTLSKLRKRPVKYLRLCDIVPEFDVKLVLRRLAIILPNEMHEIPIENLRLPKDKQVKSSKPALPNEPQNKDSTNLPNTDNKSPLHSLEKARLPNEEDNNVQTNKGKPALPDFEASSAADDIPAENLEKARLPNEVETPDPHNNNPILERDKAMLPNEDYVDSSNNIPNFNTLPDLATVNSEQSEDENQADVVSIDSDPEIRIKKPFISRRSQLVSIHQSFNLTTDSIPDYFFPELKMMRLDDRGTWIPPSKKPSKKKEKAYSYFRKRVPIQKEQEVARK